MPQLTIGELYSHIDELSVGNPGKMTEIYGQRRTYDVTWHPNVSGDGQYFKVGTAAECQSALNRKS